MPDQTIPLGSEAYGADIRLRLVGALAIAADTHHLFDRHGQMRRAQIIEHLATAAAGITYPEFYRWAEASGSSDRAAIARVTAMVQHLHNEAACARADGYEVTALGIEGSARRIAWALEGGSPTPATEPSEDTSGVPDDTQMMPATTCSAQHRSLDDGRECIRAAQHHGDHIDERGFHWSDTVAVYPLDEGAVKASPVFPRSAEFVEDERELRERVARLEDDDLRTTEGN